MRPSSRRHSRRCSSHLHLLQTDYRRKTISENLPPNTGKSDRLVSRVSGWGRIIVVDRRVGVMDIKTEAVPLAGDCPLEHLQIAVRVTEYGNGRRPMNWWIPSSCLPRQSPFNPQRPQSIAIELLRLLSAVLHPPPFLCRSTPFRGYQELRRLFAQPRRIHEHLQKVARSVYAAGDH